MAEMGEFIWVWVLVCEYTVHAPVTYAYQVLYFLALDAMCSICYCCWLPFFCRQLLLHAAAPKIWSYLKREGGREGGREGETFSAMSHRLNICQLPQTMHVHNYVYTWECDVHLGAVLLIGQSHLRTFWTLEPKGYPWDRLAVCLSASTTPN